MHNLPVPTSITGEYLSHQQEEITNLNETARSARRYAKELRDEYGALSTLMARANPAAAARFNSLLDELVLMTTMTSIRAEKLEEKGHA